MDLLLHEEIMLLSLRDREGTVAAGMMYQYALGGAMIAELLLAQRITIDTHAKNKRVAVNQCSPLGDSLLDEWLMKMNSEKKQRTLQDWVSRLASTKDLKHRIATRLCQLGILRMDEDKVLLLFTRKIYPEVNPEPERKIIARLKEAIFTETDDIGARTVILISLADSAGILPNIFDKRELKQRRKRIEQIVKGEIIGKAAHDAISAVQAALVATCVSTTLMTTTINASH